MFRRKPSSSEAVEAPAEADLAPAQQSKGRATPSRKEAEAARKAQLKGITDPKEAKKAAREADRRARYEQRTALQTGDERRLPARDAGPVRAWVRDYVDGRRSVGEFFIPIAVSVLLLGFIRVAWLQIALSLLLWVTIFLIVLDLLYLAWRLRTRAAEKFPDLDRRGITSYGLIRSVQIRRLRLPPPKVKANGQPVTPKAAKR